ncbi:MAG: hypothetical protein WD872_18470 [Pirellulaceae bacterium]
MQRTPILMLWSGGKDSALALYELLRSPAWEVVGLLTSVADEYRRVSHHGVREELLDEQAAAIGLPLDKLRIGIHGGPCTNEVYERLIGDKLAGYVARGVRHVAHGDLFLADLRAYRERNLARLDMTGVFPIWGRDTRLVVEQFESLGFRAVLCCVDGTTLDGSFVGRSLDRQLLVDLPPGVDPSGENGEYHSFVSDGPIFRWPVQIERGEVVCRDGRYYIDLVSPHAPATVADALSIPPV